jgi:hypothetical protein
MRGLALIAIAALVALGIAVLAACTASTAPGGAMLATHVSFATLAVVAVVGAIRARLASPGGGVTIIARPRAVARRARAVVAFATSFALLAFGAFIGKTTFGYAKTTNDDLRFFHASKVNTADSYADYLSSGSGRYGAEVRETLLPCAELRVILRRSTSLSDFVPLATFVQKYPASYCTDAAKSALSRKVEGVRVAFGAR